MQVLFAPSSPPSPARPTKVAHSHRHTSLKAGRILRASNPTSEANFPPVAMVTASSKPHSLIGIVDLRESTNTSPCSSDAVLARSPSDGSNSFTPSTARSRSPTRPSPPPSFSGFHTSTTPSSLPAPPPTSAPMYLTPPSRPGSPRRRATFLLPGDSDSDRERDGESALGHDDSDDSDRTSFFSAEEFVVPASALRDAVNAGGRVFGANCVTNTDAVARWQSQEPQDLSEAAREGHHIQLDSEQDAAHELRRWHALMEVVHSEVGYVRDLRVMVNVYMSLLPALPMSSPALEAVQGLTRDAVDLLELHERFSRALEVASAQVAGGTSSRGNVDKAVKQLAGLFVDEASAFDLYQRFCSTQPDVVRLLLPTQARAEWAAFERRCAAGGQDTGLESSAAEKRNPVQDPGHTQAGGAPTLTTAVGQGPKGGLSPRAMSLVPSAFKYHGSSTPSSYPPHSSSYRRHSYDSLAGVFGAGSGTMRHRPDVVRPLSDAPTRSESPVPLQNPRLRFHDFLIKPVQRICKYPLMLEGLRSKVKGDSADTVVATAVESMRAVAMRVDEARRRRETAVKSKLIVERTEPHPIVTSDFLHSLGDCLLAGSLDVVHHHHIVNPISTPVRVKYLGGLLYLGGYLLLVKVGKGKSYRVKHWFSLAPFEIVDISPDTALVPSSFRLSYMDHHFEIAVACQREKDLWLRAINEARSASPSWNSEPVSSLQILQAEPFAPPVTEGNAPDTVDAPILRRTFSSAGMSESNPLAILRLSSTKFRPSASASAPTVRYIFSHTEESSILLHRSSSGNRNYVDRGLSDVLSDLISNLRKQAQARQETLFPPPQLSDASQTIAIAAKNKLMRRGSVVVARPRMSGIPGSTQINHDRDENSGASASTLRPKTMTGYCRRMALLPALSMLYTEPESIKAESESMAGVNLQFPKPKPSIGDAILPPPITRSLTVAYGRHTPQSAPSEEPEHSPRYHRRARSLVGSVKGLMHFGSVRATASHEASEAWRTIPRPDDASSDTGDFAETDSELSTGRRRVSSAPTSPPISSTNSMFFPDSGQGSSTTSTTPDTPFPLPTPMDFSSSLTTSGTKLFRKKSASILPNGQMLKPRRSFKNFVFYNRLTTVDPA